MLFLSLTLIQHNSIFSASVVYLFLQLHQQTERPIDSPMSEGVSRGSAGSLNQPPLTLLQLEVHMCQPLCRLRWLVTICEACQEQKGGALASTVHSFLRNGDSYASNVAHTLLVAVSTIHLKFHPIFSIELLFFYSTLIFVS